MVKYRHRVARRWHPLPAAFLLVLFSATLSILGWDLIALVAGGHMIVVHSPFEGVALFLAAAIGFGTAAFLIWQAGRMPHGK